MKRDLRAEVAATVLAFNKAHAQRGDGCRIVVVEFAAAPFCGKARSVRRLREQLQRVLDLRWPSDLKDLVDLARSIEVR